MATTALDDWDPADPLSECPECAPGCIRSPHDGSEAKESRLAHDYLCRGICKCVLGRMGWWKKRNKTDESFEIAVSLGFTKLWIESCRFRIGGDCIRVVTQALSDRIHEGCRGDLAVDCD